MTCSWPGGAQLAGWVSFLNKQGLGHNTHDLIDQGSQTERAAVSITWKPASFGE